MLRSLTAFARGVGTRTGTNKTGTAMHSGTIGTARADTTTLTAHMAQVAHLIGTSTTPIVCASMT